MADNPTDSAGTLSSQSQSRLAVQDLRTLVSTVSMTAWGVVSVELH